MWQHRGVLVYEQEFCDLCKFMFCSHCINDSFVPAGLALKLLPWTSEKNMVIHGQYSNHVIAQTGPSSWQIWGYKLAFAHPE